MAATDRAETMLDELQRATRAELERQYEERGKADKQSYEDRLRSAKAEARKAEDEANHARICSAKDREEGGRLIAEFRRGKWYELGFIAGSAVGGLVAGYNFQRMVDVRLGGLPAGAIAGAPGVGFGLALDESVAARAVLFVGGTMFAAGTFVYTHCHPEKEEIP